MICNYFDLFFCRKIKLDNTQLLYSNMKLQNILVCQKNENDQIISVSINYFGSFLSFSFPFQLLYFIIDSFTINLTFEQRLSDLVAFIKNNIVIPQCVKHYFYFLLPMYRTKNIVFCVWGWVQVGGWFTKFGVLNGHPMGMLSETFEKTGIIDYIHLCSL